MTIMRLLGIPGSLREGSHNRELLETLQRIVPPGIELEIAPRFIDLPLYCEDLESDPPAKVRSVWEQLSDVDGLIFATPEYNHSIPGTLKNALDWLSRSPKRAGLYGAPVAVIGAATGPGGTRLAQQQVRNALVISGAAVMPGPFLFHGDARNKQIDEVLLRTLLQRFARWVEAIRNWSAAESLAST